MYFRFQHTDAQKPLEYVFDERHTNCHSQIGTLGATVAPDKSLHFIVTFQAIPSLHENYTIFGYAIHGFEVLKHIEYFGHRHTGKPLGNLVINETGGIFQ